MSFLGRLKGFAANRPLALWSRQFDVATRSLDENFSALLQAHDNQSKMLHEKLSALVQALDNQSDLLNQKLSALSQGLDNQSNRLHEKLSALSQGVDNQSELLNRKLDDLSNLDDINLKLDDTNRRLDDTNRKLDDVRFNSVTALELQQAELVMQRDVTDAMHELTRSFKGIKSLRAPAANQARGDGRTPLT